MDGEVDVVQDDGRALGLTLGILEANALEDDSVPEPLQNARMLGFDDFVMVVHEVEDCG